MSEDTETRACAGCGQPVIRITPALSRDVLGARGEHRCPWPKRAEHQDEACVFCGLLVERYRDGRVLNQDGSLHGCGYLQPLRSVG